MPDAPVSAALVGGLLAAVAVPLDRPGVGWAVMGLAAAVTVAVAVRRARIAGRVRWPWALATLALLAVGAFRDSRWLFALCVVTACLTASLAMAGGKTVRGLAFGATAIPAAAARDLPRVRRTVQLHARRRGGTAQRAAAVAGVSVVLLLVFGALLASADAAFAAMLNQYAPKLDGGAVFESSLVFAVVAVVVLGACSALAVPLRVAESAGKARRPLQRYEWALPVAALVLLFAAFVGVQVTVLFGGGDLVLRTSGLTYAEYARQGFWQLSAVTVLTLVVIGVVATRVTTARVADRWWLRGLLGTLALLTLVIVASAMSRMWAYQQAYGFTVLRVLVSACEIWLGLVYVMVLVAGIRLKAAWLPRAVAGTAVASLLALAVLDADRFIAERNVDRWEASGRIDLDYVGRLSADAAPALLRLPEPLRSCAVGPLKDELTRYADDGWRGANLARERARAAVASTGSADWFECSRLAGWTGSASRDFGP